MRSVRFRDMKRLAIVMIFAVLPPLLLHAQHPGHEAEQAVAKVLQSETVLQFAKQLLAHPRAESDELMHLITNKLVRPEIEPVPIELNPRTFSDTRQVLRTMQVSQFGCTLSLPWGVPTYYRVATNAMGVGFLHVHVKPGIAVTLWDPEKPSQTDLFFQEPAPAALLRVGLDQRTLASPLSLWSRALATSSRDVHQTNSVPRLAEVASLLIYKMGIWPFKTDTLYAIEKDAGRVFQFGCPQKDRRVRLEFFLGDKHASVRLYPLKDPVGITQRDVLDVVEGFRLTGEDRTNRSTVPRKARRRASLVR
jgi:hypothetical protein